MERRCTIGVADLAGYHFPLMRLLNYPATIVSLFTILLVINQVGHRRVHRG